MAKRDRGDVIFTLDDLQLIKMLLLDNAVICVRDVYLNKRYLLYKNINFNDPKQRLCEYPKNAHADIPSKQVNKLYNLGILTKQYIWRKEYNYEDIDSYEYYVYHLCTWMLHEFKDTFKEILTENALGVNK